MVGPGGIARPRPGVCEVLSACITTECRSYAKPGAWDMALGVSHFGRGWWDIATQRCGCLSDVEIAKAAPFFPETNIALAAARFRGTMPLREIPGRSFSTRRLSKDLGWVAEWSIAHAWKACLPQGNGGSNPPPSAILIITGLRAASRLGNNAAHNKCAVAADDKSRR